MPIPENRNKVLKDLKDEKFIHKNDGGSWDITNYGALMIAADLKLFEGLEKRSVRVIRYSDRSRVSGIGEKIFYSGYAISFEEIIQYILTVIPQEEIMENGIRRQKYSFPETAIRELLANIMVHQLWKAFHKQFYAKLIVMQSQFRIPFKTQESGTFYFA